MLSDRFDTVVVMSELAPRSELLDVLTGELLPATPENAHAILARLADMEQQIRTARAAVTEFVREESERQGTKTFDTPGGKLVLEGGPEIQVEGHDLAMLLSKAGMPDERIKDVVTEVITYKVNRRVLEQMARSNPNYREAAEMTSTTVERPWRARAK